MREGGLFFICWRFCLLIWYVLAHFAYMIFARAGNHVACLHHENSWLLCLAWLELEWTFGIFCVLDLICIFIGSCLNAFMKIRLPGLVLLCPSCIIYCLSRVGKRLFVFTCSHFKFVVQSFIFYRKESDSRWSRYFVAASLFIPSCWTSQVICWRFQWRCFRWADSDFTDLQKHNCVDRNRRPAMTFFEKKQASKSKQDGGRILYSTLLYSFGITRQGIARHVSESRHRMNLRNVKLFRAVMHDELEMTIYVNDDLVFGSSSG
jgi:hypothetical protein